MPPPIAYALIGETIDDSPSPAMHNAAFEAHGINASYRLRPTDGSSLEHVIKEMHHGKWGGLNLTMPLKTLVCGMVQLQGHASRAKAANTLWRYGSEIHGALTDVDGIRVPMEEEGYSPKGSAVIIGTGGAARAAAIALDSLGSTIHIVARNPHSAREFLEEIAPNNPGRTSSISDTRAIGDIFSGCNAIIQATPVGRDSTSHDLPWDQVPQGAIAFDMVYKPVRTQFLLDAEKAGCKLIEGWRMLLAQGVAAQRLWTGRQAPEEAMKKALCDELEIVQTQEAV